MMTPTTPTETTMIRALPILLALLLAAGAHAQETDAETPDTCSTRAATLDVDYATARASDCTVLGDRRFRVTIEPEGRPVNHSAWYGFRLTPERPGMVRVEMRYAYASHRYAPKISTDGINWELLGARNVRLSDDGTRAHLRIRLEDKPVFVSAQEIFTPGAYETWMTGLVDRADVEMSQLGASRQGRPLYRLDHLAPDGGVREAVVFIGRQHPPEITGGVAMLAFVDAVFAETDLAQRFRDRFDIHIVPMANPDGVLGGYWRHNMGGVDLNRDWRAFSQPETQAMRDMFLAIQDDPNQRLRLFLDFHSTAHNVLYTQAEEQETDPVAFSDRWVDAAAPRLMNYDVHQSKGNGNGTPNAKSWVYAEFGVPSITYEVGDEVDRGAVRAAAVVFAEEMMRILLAEPKPEGAGE